jgi:hypothetical protein
MNDQDSNRSPEGNVLRFALHRQGQNSQVSARCHAMPCRGSLLVLPNSVGLGYRPTGLNVQPSTDRRNGFLPALNDRVSTQESDECSENRRASEMRGFMVNARVARSGLRAQ